MPVKQTSGIDALLEALRQSGMNVDSAGFGGKGGSDADPASADAKDASSARGGAGGGRAATPHIEIPFADRM